MRVAGWLVIVLPLACGAPAPPAAGAPQPARMDTLRTDSAGMLPAGYGTLRQDDLALKLDVLSLQVRLLPLDESILRTLASDSYRALHDLRESQREQVAAVGRRTGTASFSLWYVSFFTVELGETRFSPMDLVITNVGRDFRPLTVFPLTPGFGQHRVRQRETHSALYVFEGQLDPNQPLVVTYETTRNNEWNAALQRIERERLLIRSRARS